MRTMQQTLTQEITDVANAMNLEIVDGGHAAANDGTFLVMDGLDTRLVIEYSFQHGKADFAFSGQAVDTPGKDFFLAKNVFPQVYRGNRKVRIQVIYHEGDSVRRLTGLLKDVLAPYALTRAQGQPDGEIRPVAYCQPTPFDDCLSRL